MYTSITTFANKLSDIGIAVYSNDGTFLPFSQSKQEIIKFIEYIDLNSLIKCYDDISEDEINELFLLQEIVGKQSYTSNYHEVRSGLGNEIIYFNYD